ELLRGAAHGLVARGRVDAGIRAELDVEQREERRERLIEAILLEHGPAVLVERLLVESRVRTALEQPAVRLLRLGVTPFDEQRLAAAKLGLLVVRGARILGHEPLERL